MVVFILNNYPVTLARAHPGTASEDMVDDEVTRRTADFAAPDIMRKSTPVFKLE